MSRHVAPGHRIHLRGRMYESGEPYPCTDAEALRLGDALIRVVVDAAPALDVAPPAPAPAPPPEPTPSPAPARESRRSRRARPGTPPPEAAQPVDGTSDDDAQAQV